MKGIVLEIRDGLAAVLLEDGSVTTVKKACKVGDTIEVTELEIRHPAKPRAKKKKTKVLSYRWIPAVATAAAAFLVATGLYYTLQVQASSYVTVDVNPSIQYVLNRRNRVIEVEALNDDANEIVTTLQDSVKGETLTEAIDETAALLTDAGYLTGDTDTVLVSVASDSEDTTSTLCEQVADSSICQEDSSLSVIVDTTDIASHDEAEENDISTGRYVEAGYGNKTGMSVYEDGTLQEPPADTAATNATTESTTAGTTEPATTEAPAEEATTQTQIPLDEARDMSVSDITQAAQEAASAAMTEEPAAGTAGTDQTTAPADDGTQAATTGSTTQPADGTGTGTSTDQTDQAIQPQDGTPPAQTTGDTTQPAQGTGTDIQESTEDIQETQPADQPATEVQPDGTQNAPLGASGVTEDGTTTSGTTSSTTGTTGTTGTVTTPTAPSSTEDAAAGSDGSTDPSQGQQQGVTGTQVPENAAAGEDGQVPATPAE